MVRARTRARSTWARLDLHAVGAVLEGPPVLLSVYRKLKQGVAAAVVGQEATHVLVRVRGLGVRVNVALTLALTLTLLSLEPALAENMTLALTLTLTVSGFCWSSGGLELLGSMLLLPCTWLLKLESRNAADLGDLGEI